MEYNNKIPGPTIYDQPYTDKVEAEKEVFESSSNAPQEDGKFDFKNTMALASLLLGAGSLLVLLVIPFFGLMLAGAGGVMGLVFGLFARKEKYARIGIVLSAIALVLVLIGLIILCVLGWNLLLSWIQSFSNQGYYSIPGIPNGFYFR